MKKLFTIFIFVLLLSMTINSATAMEITFWTHEDPNRTEIEDRYIAEFEQANPGVTVKRVTSGSGQIQELLLTAFAANQGPDIFNMSIEDEYAYIVNERLSPVDFEAAGYPSLRAVYDAYISGVLDPATYKGQLYGLPLELTNWCIYLNKKVFKDVGLDPEKDYPKTWEEMVEVSEKIAVREGEILNRRGFDFRYPYHLVSTVPMVEQLGSPTYTNARKLFNKDNNDIGMCLTGLYQQGRIKSDNPDFYNSGEWMVVPFPVFKNAVKDVPAAYYGHYYMVNGQKPKENQQKAWKFVAYMLSHPEEYLTKVNIVQPTVELMKSETYKSMPFSEVFTNDMAKGHIVYYGENSAQIQSHIVEAIQSVMLAGVSPEDALKTLRRKVQEVLDEG
jgi:multiple sugar transport system substrate-binding protein